MLICAAHSPRTQSGARFSPGWGEERDFGESWDLTPSDTTRSRWRPFLPAVWKQRAAPLGTCRPQRSSGLSRRPFLQELTSSLEIIRHFVLSLLHLSTVCFVLHFFWFVLFPAPLIFHCNIEDCFCVYGLQHRVGNWYLLIEISILREDRYIVYKALQIIPKLFVSIPEDVFWTIYIVA